MIIDKFEEQVKKYPNRLAVKTADLELTYQKLNDHANAVALKLINESNTTDFTGLETVALLFEHGNDMVVGTMGALKAAKVYVPMDPSYPSELLKYMLDNCEANVIITNDKNLELTHGLISESKAKVRIINISKIPASTSQELLNVKTTGHDLVYILYTSGSTGRPKGVMQSHQNVLHFIKCYSDAIKITPEDRMTLLSSFCHDAAIVDIYSALLNGASLHLLDAKSDTSLNTISDWLRAERISIWHSVPTLYRYFINTLNAPQDTLPLPEGQTHLESDDLRSLRFIVLGGEAVLPHDITNYSKIFSSAKLAVIYGQSESSINSMQIYPANCQPEALTLGEPVAATEILVVDENREEVSPLEVGEIVILSNYVALGYWQEPEKSKHVFEESAAVKLFFTGDLGRLLPDDSIEFFGRKDFQVKIRGFRIELGGIENRLLEHQAVKEAVVIAREEAAGEKYLCAYLVADEDVATNDLREHLANSLPEYMIPAYFMQLERMPLTPNGKIDRKAFPEPSRSRAEYVAPRNKTEAVLAQIWCEVLKCERVGINDNFFELGGHSLKAAMVINKINMELNVNVPLLQLYATPFISDMGSYISEAKDEFESIPGLSLLKKGKRDRQNFFIIHAGQGKAAVYIKLVNHLNDEFNYWGISYEDPTYYDPYVIPLEELAAKYIEKIKKIQEEGPYYISGWCIGGVIAFEVVKQLEAAGDKIGFVGMYNSPVAGRKKLQRFFTETEFKVEAELNLLQKLFPEYNFSQAYKDTSSFVALWDQVTEDLERAGSHDEKVKEKVYDQICLESPRIKRVVKDYQALEISELLHYFNSLRLLSNVFWRYYPKGKISAPISYFVATKEERESKMLWTKRSHKEVNFHYIDVDHFAMFVDDEDVKKLASALTDTLNSKQITS